MIVLEPNPAAGAAARRAGGVVGLRLELEHRPGCALGRDVVGRQVTVNVAKNRFGPPGRAAEIEIRYLEDGEHAPRDYAARRPVTEAQAVA